MTTQPKLPEEISDKYIEWIQSISMWDPKEMRNFMAENIKNILDKFAGDLLFLAQKNTDTHSKDNLTANVVIEIIKEIGNFLPPMEMN